MKRQLLIFAALFVVQLFLPSDAAACSCGTLPTVKDEMNSGYVKTIVTGRIESVYKIREEEREHDIGAYLSATLVVDKVYHGNVKPGDRLVLAQGGGADCAFTWDEKAVGSEWLFYLGDPSAGNRYLDTEDKEILRAVERIPMHRTSFCGRSTSLSSAARDLAYLENLSKLRGMSRVSGELEFYESGQHRSVEGIEVRLTSKDVKLKGRYGKAGFFEFYDVPPGEYLLEIVPPRGWVAIPGWRSWREIQEFPDDVLKRLRKNQRLIRVSKGDHTEVDLSLTFDTKVGGRVLSPAGKPMPKVCVNAEPASNSKDDRGGQSCTDEKGEFSIPHLRPGNYLLVANPRGKVDAHQPFGKLYYPGVTAAAEAGVVSIDAGGNHLGIDFQIPQLSRLIEISGRVLFADNKPAEGAWIKFEPDAEDRFLAESVRTDADGRFTLKVPFGASGKIIGSKYFSEYSYPNCPAIQALAKKTGSDLKTSELELDGTRSIPDLVLRFPADSCAKKMEN